jgi:beta-glucosidase
MPRAAYTFPAGFLWGTATSSHQVEGGNTNNNWSAWEQQPGRIINEHKAGLACDWWGGRWSNDFDRAAEGGQNAHRLSIEWSRVQPAPDRWNDDALDVYREMLRGLYQRNITPLVTLHHFTDPLWLAERGGWENAETPALFETYTRRVVDALRSYCSLWVTINEPNVYVYSGYLGGEFPPGKNDRSAAFNVMVNMLRGHALAYRAIKSLQKEARVGIATNTRAFRPARAWMPLDAPVANALARNFNASFNDALADGRFRFAMRSTRVPEAIGTQDFVGVNYYTTDLVSFNLLKPGLLFGDRRYPPEAELSDTGFIANVPDGFGDVLKWAAGYHLPVLVTENGIEDADDHLRPRYLAEHVHQVWRALNNNVPIKGYLHWSLVDNFEWERGWTQRFGLWGLDVETQTRTRRPSVNLYAAICKQNALSAEMVENYAPAAVKTLFPG